MPNVDFYSFSPILTTNTSSLARMATSKQAQRQQQIYDDYYRALKDHETTQCFLRDQHNILKETKVIFLKTENDVQSLSTVGPKEVGPKEVARREFYGEDQPGTKIRCWMQGVY
ncbi:unnamed protein product [Darwinula stevensoni]|uniref:Uncharacterized protein n=1 Tax=Darwinula stevensoni TaxID=69355 RepID=A0A7R8XI59_9CRUS|nr:unnamed protein product [Darwinula stevensoni]CAG0893530.1 unnamed protein product [Darwinula stevensoni]